MLRLAGALLLAVGAAWPGFSAAGRLSRRVTLLETLLAAVERMEREIAFSLTPLPRLFSDLAEECPPPAGAFFACCRDGLEELRTCPLARLWLRALEETLPELEGRGRAALAELGSSLGRYDGDSQRRALARAEEELLRALEEARGERDKQGRVYRVLGVTAGAFLVILLL